MLDGEKSEGGGAEVVPRKRSAVVVVGATMLLFMVGFTVLFFAGLPEMLASTMEGGDAPKSFEAHLPKGEPAFYDLPDLMVSLGNVRTGSPLLKLRLTLELESPRDVAGIKMALPRIVNEFQIYGRELRLDDLQGASGLSRLRHELKRRAATAAATARVKDVLVREVFVQ